MGGRGPAQVVAPLQAESVGVELDQRRDHVVEGQDALGSRLRAKQTFARAARWSGPVIRPLDGLAAPTAAAPSCAPFRSSPTLQRGRSHLPGCGRTIRAYRLIDR